MGIRSTSRPGTQAAEAPRPAFRRQAHTDANPGPAALELVPEPVDTSSAHPADQLDALHRGPRTDDGAANQDWRADTVISQWDAEHQLIGALLWLTADQARPILELVADSAIWRPISRWALEVIRRIVNDGRDPDPVIVLRTARHQPSTGALQPDQPTSAGRYRDFALYLANAYTHVLYPHAARIYAREVLDDAYRRAFREHGMRMQQMSECGSDRADLTEHFAAARRDLAELWRRAEAAAKPDKELS